MHTEPQVTEDLSKMFLNSLAHSCHPLREETGHHFGKDAEISIKILQFQSCLGGLGQMLLVLTSLG